MKETFSVIMLPAEKASALVLNLDNELEYDEVLRSYCGVTQQHLYFTSDDEPKEGDWCVLQVAGVLLIDKSSGKNIFETIGLTHPNCEPKKIVATTDKLLGVELNPKSSFYLEGMLPQIPESFIQDYIKTYNEGKPITEVDLEMELAHMTMSAIIQDKAPKYAIKTRPDNTVIIHQSKVYTQIEVDRLLDAEAARATAQVLKSKMYSRDEVIKLIKKCYDQIDMDESEYDFNNWIEENLSP